VDAFFSVPQGYKGNKEAEEFALYHPEKNGFPKDIFLP